MRSYEALLVITMTNVFDIRIELTIVHTFLSYQQFDTQCQRISPHL